MNTVYFASFALAFLISFVATFLVSRIAVRKKILDMPDNDRKLHKTPTPTLGGIAIYSSFFLVTLAIGVFAGYLLNGNIPFRALLGIWAGGAILMIGGYLDDRYNLPPAYSILFPTLASICVVTSGIQVVSLHHPLTNEIIFLTPVISGIAVFLWTMTMTYTTKLLDGMDGLVTGLSAIAAIILFGISLGPEVQQPQTALLAITFAGALLGFLILNFYPAKIFLGEGGSTLAGFMLAVLAVVSGGKIATALLVMGIPLLDMAWVVVQRLFSGKSPFSGDRKHLHFRLTEIGFSVPQAVLFLYSLAGIFGMSALFLQSRGKMVALIILFLVMISIVATLFALYRTKGKAE
jgi:UDP-GlcNAc:undecaprenyl-phosphate GlcNAc-1-phosphate transferase